MANMGVFAATSHGMLIVAHRFAPAPTLTPFTYTIDTRNHQLIFE
jgi:hypothetical protein